MDDYYELLDVAPDADRDDIRGAYRAKREELQASNGEEARAQIAELNRAWNVLSDPTQRERYDERLAESREYYDGDEDDEEYEDGDEEGDGPQRRVPITRAQRREAALARRGKQMPTIELPNGLTAASTRSRLTAMGIDLVILLALFSAVQVLGVSRVDARFPGERHEASTLQKQVDSLSKQISAEKKKFSTATDKHDTAAATAAKNLQDTYQKQHDTKVKRIDAIDRDFAPGLKIVYAIGVVIAFLYLVPLTALTGQTVGKRFQKVRVVHLPDGSVPGWPAATKRYGVPLLFALILGVAFLGQYALLIAIVSMVGWVNRPDHQGLHDRFAKTVVVDA